MNGAFNRPLVSARIPHFRCLFRVPRGRIDRSLQWAQRAAAAWFFLFGWACSGGATIAAPDPVADILYRVFSAKVVDPNLFIPPLRVATAQTGINKVLAGIATNGGTFQKIERLGGTYVAEYDNVVAPVQVILSRSNEIFMIYIVDVIDKTHPLAAPAKSEHDVKTAASAFFQDDMSVLDPVSFPDAAPAHKQLAEMKSALGAFHGVIFVRGSYVAQFVNGDAPFNIYVTSAGKIAGIVPYPPLPVGFATLGSDARAAFSKITLAGKAQYTPILTGSSSVARPADDYETYDVASDIPGTKCYAFRRKSDIYDTRVSCDMGGTDDLQNAFLSFRTLQNELFDAGEAGWKHYEKAPPCNSALTGTPLRLTQMYGGSTLPLVTILLVTNAESSLAPVHVGHYLTTLTFSQVPPLPVTIAGIDSEIVSGSKNGDIAYATIENGQRKIYIDDLRLGGYPPLFRDFLVAHERAHQCLGHVDIRERAREHNTTLDSGEYIHEEFEADRAGVVSVMSAGAKAPEDTINDLINELQALLVGQPITNTHPLPNDRLRAIIDTASEVRNGLLNDKPRASEAVRASAASAEAVGAIYHVSITYINKGHSPVDCAVTFRSIYWQKDDASLKDPDWVRATSIQKEVVKRITLASFGSQVVAFDIERNPSPSVVTALTYPTDTDATYLLNCH